ncbi:MAG: NAD(P)-dependent alcohol dehydrogenase [Acidimicrobiales bacterium]|nr:NAD(P)-dependent alcohol dehydrogenase [Acidimicrobiales bacterium]
MKTRAAVLRSPEGPFAVEDVELAPPGSGQILVRVAGAGVCHTDLLHGEGLGIAPLPAILGHEGAGVVEAVGDDVEGIAEGDHVVLSFTTCGSCRNCADGHPAYCDTFLFRNLGGRAMDGTTGVTDAEGADVSSRFFGQSSLAAHCVADARHAVVVDRDLPLELLGPLGCGFLTGAGSVVNSLGVQEGMSVVVTGAGAVGLAAVMAAKALGAGTIIAVDRHESRLELARELGATHTVGADADLAAEILGITAGGADRALDTTGVPAVILATLASLRMTGVLGMVGAQHGDLVLDGLTPLGKTITAIFEGDAVPRELIPRLLGWWREGLFPFDRLIETFPLDEIEDAIAASRSGRVVKPVLVP